jgi:hypothetical protein
VEAVEQLTAEIQKEMECCTFHITHDSLLNLFENFQIIGLDDIKSDNQYLNNKVEKFYSIIKILEAKISQHEKILKIEKINSLENKTAELNQKMKNFALLDHPFNGIKSILRFFYSFIISLLGFPVALVATLVNIFPFIAAKKLGRKIAGKDISLIPAARLMSGVVIYIIYYLSLLIFFGINTGIINSIVISSSLFVGGYLTLWYWEALKSFSMASKKIYYWLTNRKIINELIEKRVKILNDLNSLLEL